MQYQSCGKVSHHFQSWQSCENRNRQLAHLAPIYIHRFLSKFSEKVGVISKCDIKQIIVFSTRLQTNSNFPLSNIFAQFCCALPSETDFFLFMAVVSDWWLLKQAAWACHPNANTASLLTCKRLNPFITVPWIATKFDCKNYECECWGCSVPTVPFSRNQLFVLTWFVFIGISWVEGGD
jgi:hypothetical protein